MNKHILLAVIVSLLMTGWGMVETRAADESAPAVLSLDQVNAKISALESALMASITERERARHELEYGDAEISPKRVESKKLEKQLVDLRQQYVEKLRISDKEYRDLEAEIGKKYDAMNDLKQLGEAIQREVTLAGIATNTTNKDVPVLKVEDSLNQEQIEQIRVEIADLNAKLAEKKKQMTMADADLTRLADEIEALGVEHRRVLAELGASMDQTDTLKALDAQRQVIMTELREWRAIRDRLEKSKSADR